MDGLVEVNHEMIDTVAREWNSSPWGPCDLVAGVVVGAAAGHCQEVDAPELTVPPRWTDYHCPARRLQMGQPPRMTASRTCTAARRAWCAIRSEPPVTTLLRVHA